MKVRQIISEEARLEVERALLKWSSNRMRAFQTLIYSTVLTGLAGFVPVLTAKAATNASVTVQVDAAADRHVINPLIYGLAFATSNQLQD